MAEKKHTLTTRRPFGLTYLDISLLFLLVLALCVGLIPTYLLVQCKRGNANLLCSSPTTIATGGPTDEPTEEPTGEPTAEPTETPTKQPTDKPAKTPTNEPPDKLTETPTSEATATTNIPTFTPTSTNTPSNTSTSMSTTTATISTTSAPTVTSTATPVIVPTPKPATVVYVQSNHQYHVLNIAKSNGEFIKGLGMHTAAPAWSPDVTRIAFFGEPGINQRGDVYRQGEGIWIIDAWQEQEAVQLVYINNVENITWSPDGTKLAFEIEMPGIADQIVVVDVNDSREISRFYGEQPAWSPNSQNLVIKACRPGCGLWLTNFLGSVEQQITYDGTDSYPAWSLNGRYLAFASENRDGDWEIYWLQMADDTPQGQPQRLTWRDGVDTTPVFGPDGREIYLRTDAFGGWRITAIRMDGSNERLVMEGVGPSNDWGLARPAVH